MCIRDSSQHAGQGQYRVDLLAADMVIVDARADTYRGLQRTAIVPRQRQGGLVVVVPCTAQDMQAHAIFRPGRGGVGHDARS